MVEVERRDRAGGAAAAGGQPARRDRRPGRAGARDQRRRSSASSCTRASTRPVPAAALDALEQLGVLIEVVDDLGAGGPSRDANAGCAARDHLHRDDAAHRPADPAPVARRRPRAVRRPQRRPRGDALLPVRARSRSAATPWPSGSATQSTSAAGGCGPSRSGSGAPFIGFIGLQPIPFEAHFTPAVEVGWRLARGHWGRGYAPEGARAAVDFGFDELGLDEIVSMTTAGEPALAAGDAEARDDLRSRPTTSIIRTLPDLGAPPPHLVPTTVGAMEQRILGRTGRPVSVVGLGTWQLGADWGDVDETTALDVLAAAVDAGVTLFDTADVYGDGRSEQLIGRFLREHPDADVFVATKMGRRVEQVPENYVLANFREWNDRSRRNLGVDRLDLVQLHCPPTRRLQLRRGVRRARHDGRRGTDRRTTASASRRVDEALTAIARPHVASVQIILNAFRQKPLEQVLPAAAEAGVGILARVPLASGPAVRPLHRRHHLRRRRPPQLQPARRGVRRRRDLRRRRLRRPASPRPRSSRRWRRPASRRRSSRCAGSSTSPGSRPSSPVPATPSRRGATPPRPGSTRSTPSVQAEIRELYDRRIRRLVHDKW